MAAIDYEKTACTALGIPHLEEVEADNTKHHNIGFFKIWESDAATEAATVLRCRKVAETIQPFLKGGERYREGIDEDIEIAEETAGLFSFKEYHYIISNRKALIATEEQYINTHHQLRAQMGASGQIADKLNKLVAQIDSLESKRPRHIWYAFLTGEHVRLKYNHLLNTPDFAGYRHYLEQVTHFGDMLKSRKVAALLPEKDRLRHTYITGGSGSGKSELLKQLIYSYVHKLPNYAAVVLIEPHGDLAAEVARWHDFAEADRLIYIDPMLEDGHTPTLNPLQLPRGVNLDVYAQQLLNVFEELLAGSGGTSLTNNMRAVLMPCIKVLLGMNGATFLDLQRFMQKDERSTKYIQLGKQAENAQTREFFTHDFEQTKFNQTKDAIATKISSLLNTEAEQNLFLGKNTFDLEQAINQKKVIVCRFSKGHIGDAAAQAFGRFMLASLQSLAIRRAQLEKASRVPVHVFLDECQNYITPSIEVILQEARKYGVHLTAAQQIFGMGMGRDMRQIILGNTEVKITGQNQHIETLKRMASITGADLDSLQNLELGKFSIRAGNNRPFVLHVKSNLVVDKDSGHSAADMSDKQWQQVKAQQLAQYYRSTASTPSPAASDNGGSQSETLDLV